MDARYYAVRWLGWMSIPMLLLAACDEAGDSRTLRTADPSHTAAPTLAPSPEPSRRRTDPKPETSAPHPATPLPRRPQRLAEAIVRNHRALYRAVEGWRGGRSGPRPVSLEALYQQRIYRLLGRDDDLADAVVGRLPASVARSAEANRSAVRSLLSLVEPIEPPIELGVRRPEPPESLKRYYREAERKSGVPWQLLASVNFVESRFGRVTGPSTAGALGPMQFLPSTWEQYGEGGDIRDPHDSILAAARYLAASGAPTDTRSALYAYNRSFDYVDAIQVFAREMRRDAKTFYGYYFWQVFVTTTQGDVQLTGPGSR